MRAIRLASATATTIRGLHASILASHGSSVLPRRTDQRTTAMAPVISSSRRSRWPIFDYLKKYDRALQQAKQAEHRNGSAWYGRGARALGLEPGKHVSAGKFEKLLKGHVIGTDVRLGRLL